jgi:hypothetical protein
VVTEKTGKGRWAFSIDTALGSRGEDNRGFAGVSEPEAAYDSIRGHHDRFVCQWHQLGLHSIRN